MSEFSDIVIYADESGDHSLTKIDNQYPVFVLSLCIFEKKYYINKLVPKIQSVKFHWFGSDTVILHERDIRKQHGKFAILSIRENRESFMKDLNNILSASKMKIACCAIDKRRLTEEYLFPDNPYHLALQFCLENAFLYIREKNQISKITHCLFEKRGKKEDEELELEFLRITNGANCFRTRMDCFKLEFVDKRANCSGLQIADLTARPIGLHVIRPHQQNRAYGIIQRKLYIRKTGRKASSGPKIFP